jgi:methylated-DNA-[protein]-cysteine S-methyltransferase
LALPASHDARQAVVFETEIGWMALVGCAQGARRLTFGHKTASAAKASLLDGNSARFEWCSPEDWPLVARLTAYAAGNYDDFRDVKLQVDRAQTAFIRRVVEACRAIPPGETRSYGQLAVEAGSPGAARAVGQVMARNPLPIIVPCHRVLGAGGRLGGYSMGSGLPLKRRLLALEAAMLCAAS